MNRCPCSCPGDRHCQCSRDYTRAYSLWMWRSLCSGVKRLNVGDWLAIAMLVLVVCAVVFK